MNALKVGDTAFIKCKVENFEDGHVELIPVGNYSVPFLFPENDGSIIPIPIDAPNNPPKPFEVDDEVVSLMHGKGRVIEAIDDEYEDIYHPVIAEFKDKQSFAFTLHGFFAAFDTNRTLFHKFENVRVVTEPTFTYHEQRIKEIENQISDLQKQLKTLK